MAENSDSFMSLSIIKEFQSQPEYVNSYSLSYSYPILAIIVSSNKIVTFNLETKVTLTIERKKPGEKDSSVLCSAISNDKMFVATGHSDSNGGELVIWSLETKRELFSFRTSDPIVKILFGNSPNQIFHTSLYGILTLSTITSTIFKGISVTHKEIKNYNGPVISMAVHQDFLFISAALLTECIYINKKDFPIMWQVHEETNCFAFYDTQNNKNIPKNFLARGFNHQMNVSTIDCKKTVTYNLSKTPRSITFIDLNTIFVLYDNTCELIRDNSSFIEPLPSGLAAGFSDRIFVLNSNHLYQVLLASIEQRVNVYISKNQWSLAFDQINSVEDFPNVDELFDKYINSKDFTPKFLFTVIEKLERTEYVTNLHFLKRDLPPNLTDIKLTEIELNILRGFVESGIMHWPLNLNFILLILFAYHDKQSDHLYQFMTTVELNFQWLPSIYDYCIKERMFRIISTLSFSYSMDYYLNLVLYYYEEKYKDVHNLIDSILITSKTVPTHAILFLLAVDLTNFIRFDVDHSALIIQSALDFLMEQAQRPLQPPKDFITLLNKVIYAIDKDDEIIWRFLIKEIQINKIQIDKSLIPQIENFLFNSNSSDKTMRDQLFIYLLNSGQVSDLQRALFLVRSSGLENSELEIIRYTRDVNEFISFVIIKNKKSFRDGLYRVLNDDLKAIHQVCIDRCSLLMSINADEFCNEIINIGSSDMIHNIYQQLFDNKILLWHFMKHVFSCTEFCDKLNSDEIINYISLLSKYHPDDVYSVLRLFGNIPLQQVSEICKSRGILDAYLYLCNLSYDFEAALAFGKDYLCTSLIENQSKHVVQKVCEYLSSSHLENKEDAWFEFLSSFQIPLYSFMYDSKMKLETEKRKSVISLLEFFIDSMIKDTDEKNSNLIAQKFIDLFSFLPFSIARPIVTNFFKSIREKNQFKRTLLEIQKHEAVVKQVSRIKDTARGIEYDGVRCGLCGKSLGQCDAVAFHCGHVFHNKCAMSGWCSICDASNEGKIEEQNQNNQPNLIRMDMFSTELPELDPFQQNESSISRVRSLNLPTFGEVEQI